MLVLTDVTVLRLVLVLSGVGFERCWFLVVLALSGVGFECCWF